MFITRPNIPEIVPGIPFLLSNEALGIPDRVAMLHDIPIGTVITDIVSPVSGWHIGNHTEMFTFIKHWMFSNIVRCSCTAQQPKKSYSIIGGILYDFTSVTLGYHEYDNSVYLWWKREAGYMRNMSFGDKLQREESEFIWRKTDCHSYLLLIKDS